ncbi:hypothetical protein [Thermococcus sp. JCM 11816]|uniref:hypothetical protein n=1 Tax=Thermococcus sp. (strain JCM 11816 / KS-1) TaxID=1295125 RepID=UPI0006D1D33F
MAYNWAVFGSPFTVGYSKTIGYTNFAFQYILAGKVGEGLSLIWRNLLTHPELLFEGFPSLILLPAGAYIARRKKITPLLLLWFLAYFGLYFQYEWLRTGLYIFMTRFYLPMAPAVAGLAGGCNRKADGGRRWEGCCPDSTRLHTARRHLLARGLFQLRTLGSRGLGREAYFSAR